MVQQLPIGTGVERRNGWIIVSAAIPPRVCGLPNEACRERVEHAIQQINPAAFDPVTPQVAEAAERARWVGGTGQQYATKLDAVRNGEQVVNPLNPPPNCDGLTLSDQEDDEGEAIPGYPPGTSCAITGECE
jgi:hypothetical protein